MRDHQQFEKTEFANGIVLYTYQDNFPISCMEIQLPLGTAHAIPKNNLIAGSPHFLEHAQLIRTRNYPEAYALDRALGLKAASSNAATHPKATTYWIDTPAHEQSFGEESLIERVFYPLFQESDLVPERSVIANERNQNKFYPGKSKTSQYYFQEFINDVFYPVEQIFGSDEDLTLLTAPTLTEMHRQITDSNQIIALAVGPHDFSTLKSFLAGISTKPHTLELGLTPTSWTRKDYHEVYFDTVTQPRLEVAWIHTSPSYEEYVSICFFLELLTNTTQGPLYRELREEKGWAYGLDATCILREKSVISGLTFPVNTIEQVKFIRENLADRITESSNNQDLMQDEITRQLGNQVYQYQTAGSIINSASSDLVTQGCIRTEAEHREAVDKMADQTWRSHILDTYFRPDEMGSVCFLPERRE